MNPASAFRLLGAALIVGGILASAALLPDRGPDGRPLPLSLLLGAAFGLLLQRSRVCFFCVTRDFIDHRDPRGLLGIVAALAVGTIGYAVVMGAWLPVPALPRLPPDVHIGPVSLALVAGATTFGFGMALSGSCISAHLYRLGEGSPTAPFALVGTLAGFGLGFLSWNTLYLRVIQEAPVLWLPHRLGYGGWVVLQLGVLAAIAAWLLSYRSRGEGQPASASDPLHGRWPAHLGGILIGFLAVLALFRLGPLGVTAEIGSIARTAAGAAGLLPARLEGLDGFAGCATAVKEAVLSRNGVFVLGLMAGAWAGAVATGEFRPRLPTRGEVARGLAGGLLMGWGAMVALGCTVGVLLSGIMGGAVSGWVFAVACLAATWAGWRIRRRLGWV